MSANDRHFTKSQQPNTSGGRLKPKRIHEYRAVWLQLKDNGYDVIPMSGKDGPLKGWPLMPNTPADIADWKGSTAAVRMLGSGLLFIDLDVLRQDIRDVMLYRIRTRWPSFYEQCLKRHSGAVKLGLIGLCATRCPRLATRYRDADGVIHMVEIFTSECKRYVCVHGAHSPGREYGYDGRSILEVKISDLPKFKSADLSELVQLCADVFSEFGLEEVKPPEKETPAKLVYDVDETTRFDVHQGPAGISYADLVCLFYERRGADLRCSSSFIKGDDGTNTSKCKVSECFRAHHTIGVWDFGEGNWHLPAAMQPETFAAGVGEQIRGVFGEQLKLKWNEYYVKTGLPRPTLANAMRALVYCELVCRQELFHGTMAVTSTDTQLQDLTGEVNDELLERVRWHIRQKHGFDPGKEHLRDAVKLTANLNRFDLLCDTLAEAEKAWDGKPRLDRMAADLLNCEDTPYASAVVRKFMVAAVARARAPGCMFQITPVFESPEAYGKSSALRILAGPENFTDAHILGLDARTVLERTKGAWIVEIADLAGMTKYEVERVKAFLTQEFDDGRAAYEHFSQRVRRRWVMAGTTNASTYLQAQDGNRRFCSLKVLRPIDLTQLKEMRAQLWGEAAYAQSQGESLELPEAIRPAAKVTQESRRIPHHWEIRLAEELETSSYVRKTDQEWVITTHDALYGILTHTDRLEARGALAVVLANVMANLGWEPRRIGKRQVRGYSKRYHGA
jgi:Virulence-associated protein E-like domain